MANASGHNRPIVRKQDGTMEVHGTLDIKTATGGLLKIDGTDVTAGLQEIEAIAGLSAAEVALIDSVTAGTTAAGKAITTDANGVASQGAFTTVVVRAHNATGGTLTKGQLVTFVGAHTNGLPKIVLADANVADRAAEGALQADIADAAAGNVIVLGLSPATLNTDAASSASDPVFLSETAGAVAYSEETEADERSQRVGYVVAKHATTGQIFYNFRVGKIGSVDMQAGAALLNLGTTATVLEMDELDDITSAAQSTIAVAAEGGDSIDVTVTLKDAAGAAVNEARYVRCWLSSSATTGAIYTDGGITVTATTGSLLKEDTDDLLFQAVTSTAGVLVLNVAGSGDQAACYLWVQMPNGQSKVSAVIDLAA